MNDEWWVDGDVQAGGGAEEARVLPLARAASSAGRAAKEQRREIPSARLIGLIEWVSGQVAQRGLLTGAYAVLDYAQTGLVASIFLFKVRFRPSHSFCHLCMAINLRAFCMRWVRAKVFLDSSVS